MSVNDLLERIGAQTAGGAPMDWAQIREDIHAEHDRATTGRDREVLLQIYKVVMDAVERQMRGKDLDAFKKARTEEECDPDNERKMVKVRGDYIRARDNLTWMRNRLDEALDAGSTAFRR